MANNLIQGEISMLDEVKDTHSFLHVCLKTMDGYYGPLLQAVAILLFVFLFNFVIKKMLLWLRVKYSQEKAPWKFGFVTALYYPLSYFVWFVAVVAAIDLISQSILHIPLPTIELIFSVGGVIAFGWFMLRWNDSVVNSMLDKSRKGEIDWSASKLDLMRKLGTIAAVLITVVLLMDVTGRNMQTLIAFGGISGVALAFASQQFISNFFGGLMVYLTHPFAIGEWVSMPERKIDGAIEDIGWYMTRIRDADKRPIYVPNSIFNQTIVITVSRRSNQHLMLRMGLRYKDINSIKAIVDGIRALIINDPRTDHQTKTEVFFENFGATSLEIKISSYTTGPDQGTFDNYKQDLLIKFAALVAENGAEIASLTNIVEIKNPPEYAAQTQVERAAESPV
jgi:MscS family membrane protein